MRMHLTSLFRAACRALAGTALAGLLSVGMPAPMAYAADAAPAADDAFRKSVTQYQTALAAAMAQYRRYPSEALQLKREGATLLHVMIGAKGELAELQVERSSGHADLDEQALVTTRRAKQSVPIPANLRGVPFEVHVRVVYAADGAHQHGDEPGPTHPR